MLTTKQMVNSPMLPSGNQRVATWEIRSEKIGGVVPLKINSPVNIHRMVDISLFLSQQLTSFCRGIHPVDIPLNIPLTIR